MTQTASPQMPTPVLDKNAQLKLVMQSDKASIYSLLFEGEALTEFEKFIVAFRDDAAVSRDFAIIIRAVERILESGSPERAFRTEGKMSDNVGALPIDRARLRLYCIRLSDQILIIGNGGRKDTRTYQDDEQLSVYVLTLQQFEKILRECIRRGTITIEGNTLNGTEDKLFAL